MLYFAYGSNMSAPRLTHPERVPSAVTVDTGFLYGHKLAFHKPGRLDSTGKCDAFHTGNSYDYLMGVIYQIDPDDRSSLDRMEGLGNGYEVKEVEIVTSSKEVITAFTYIATRINKDLKPLHWYKHHVIYGARENNFPAKYIESILSIESIDDHDLERVERELSIYCK